MDSIYNSLGIGTYIHVFYDKLGQKHAKMRANQLSTYGRGDLGPIVVTIVKALKTCI